MNTQVIADKSGHPEFALLMRGKKFFHRRGAKNAKKQAGLIYRDWQDGQD